MALSKIQMSQFLATYGGLLTEKQREVVTMYCDCDCTLSEIAEEKNITRQGVRDAVMKAEATFVELENSLKLSAFVREVSEALNGNDDAKVVAAVKKFVEKE